GRTNAQERRFQQFQEQQSDKLIVVIELGAGSAIPTIRIASERLGWRYPGATVIRINTREPEIQDPHIGLACGALEGLQLIDEMLR
ncbi:NAD-dependent deacetylase, partial [bacterium]|nr:NAD-dependent deacetylase [bacterium]